MRTYTLMRTASNAPLQYFYSHLKKGEKPPKKMKLLAEYLSPYIALTWKNIKVGETIMFSLFTKLRRDS